MQFASKIGARPVTPTPNIAGTMFGAGTPLSLLALALLGALPLLVGGAKAVTAAAERVGLALGMSPFTVGVLIVAGYLLAAAELAGLA